MTVKEAIARELEELSDEQLLDVLQYAKSLHKQIGKQSNRQRLQGMWKRSEANLTEEAITAVRKEAWGKFPREFPE